MPLVKGEVKLAVVAQWFGSSHDLARCAIESQNILSGAVQGFALKEAASIC